MNDFKDCQEVAKRLYELCEDMDHMDYEDTKNQTIDKLSEAIYQLKAIAQNEYNQDYWRGLWNVLQII